MATEASPEAGRRASTDHAWGEAYAALTAVAERTPLGAEDLDRLAVAAYLTGHDAESAEAWARACRAWTDAGDPNRAARSAFWLGIGLLLKGEMAQGGGWLERARALIEAEEEECAEHGYLLVPVALEAMAGGDAAAACAAFERAAELGTRFTDPDLRALGQSGVGQALLRLGETTRGVAALDESMVGITAGEVSPIVAGILYCAVIESCQEVFDLRRAQEWTAALSRWCESQPDLVLYRGQCMVHRAEILQLHGDWPDALDEVQRACARLADPPGQAAVGAAFYQCAQLHRLRGDFGDAEECYRRASAAGHDPQPGLALLRLAQGRTEDAAAAIRRVVEEQTDPLSRARVLGAYVEIALAEGDVAAAQTAATELETIASDLDAPMLRAIAARTVGAVQLAAGDTWAALGTLRHACAAWRELDAPHDVARVRVLVGLAYRALGDTDTAELELEAAAGVFEQLGARPDLDAVTTLRRSTTSGAFGPLTAREAEVVALVAQGKTNRAIADELVISDKTVARHLSNIFTKLAVSSRSAATAWAYEQGLVAPSAGNLPPT
jgi:DNA-binding CsgD family transcriptional regulator